MGGAREFDLVEFASKAMEGFRNHIVRVEEVPALMERYGHTDCCTSAFVFDQRLCEHVNGNGGSVAGYHGPCYAHFLPFDIDAKDLGHAQKTTQDLCRFLLDSWAAPEEAVAIYFSGNKGFHVAFATRLLGDVEPCVELPDVLQQVRRAVVKEAYLRHPDAVDMGIGARLGLLRLPNTRHWRSGLYKVPLELYELFTYEPDEIRESATRRRRLSLTDPTGLLPLYEFRPNVVAEEVYASCHESVTGRKGEGSPDPSTYLSRGEVSSFLCEAEQRLYEQGVAKGARTRMAVRLASRMRGARYTEEEAAGMLLWWNRNNEPPERSSEIRRVVAGAFRSKQLYQSGCGTGVADPPETELVYEACPYTDRSQCPVYQRFDEQRKSRNGRSEEQWSATSALS